MFDEMIRISKLDYMMMNIMDKNIYTLIVEFYGIITFETRKEIRCALHRYCQMSPDLLFAFH